MMRNNTMGGGTAANKPLPGGTMPGDTLPDGCGLLIARGVPATFANGGANGGKAPDGTASARVVGLPLASLLFASVALWPLPSPSSSAQFSLLSALSAWPLPRPWDNKLRAPVATSIIV